MIRRSSLVCSTVFLSRNNSVSISSAIYCGIYSLAYSMSDVQMNGGKVPRILNFHIRRTQAAALRYSHFLRAEPPVFFRYEDECVRPLSARGDKENLLCNV
jgi:hypothetical protein